jgi:hypothetical protein
MATVAFNRDIHCPILIETNHRHVDLAIAVRVGLEQVSLAITVSVDGNHKRQGADQSLIGPGTRLAK